MVGGGANPMKGWTSCIEAGPQFGKASDSVLETATACLRLSLPRFRVVRLALTW